MAPRMAPEHVVEPDTVRPVATKPHFPQVQPHTNAVQAERQVGRGTRWLRVSLSDVRAAIAAVHEDLCRWPGR